MPSCRASLALALALGVVALGCAAPVPSAQVGGTSPAGAPVASPTGSGALKRLTVGTIRQPDLHPGAATPAQTVNPLVSSGLSATDAHGGLHALLATAVPSLDNGLWVLNPDGTMVTTYPLHATATWHDGTPLTADDLLFSLQVGMEPGMSAFASPGQSYIAVATAPDPHTLRVTWSQPYIGADSLFSGFNFPSPLPRHLLEEPYRTDKTSLLDLSYWGADFIGAGPFKLREWVPGERATVVANAAFVQGRPAIDEITVQFIPDVNTLAANLEAGTVDVSGNAGSVDDGLALQSRWRDGTVVFDPASGSWVAVYPQLSDPTPAIVGDLRFRTALLLATDRQAIADALVGGKSLVPLSFLGPNQPQYAALEATLPRYAYDPQRAGQLIADLGYTKGGDGVYHDGEGQRLEVPLVSQPGDLPASLATTIADAWQRLGVASTATRLTPQQAADPKTVATFPAFYVSPHNDDLPAVGSFASAAAPLPTNNYRVSGAPNSSRYVDPALDRLIDRYFTTVPLPDRLDLLGQIVHVTTDQLTVMGYFYNPIVGAVAHRVAGVSAEWQGPIITWNVQEWDVTG